MRGGTSRVEWKGRRIAKINPIYVIDDDLLNACNAICFIAHFQIEPVDGFIFFDLLSLRPRMEVVGFSAGFWCRFLSAAPALETASGNHPSGSTGEWVRGFNGCRANNHSRCNTGPPIAAFIKQWGPRGRIGCA